MTIDGPSPPASRLSLQSLYSLFGLHTNAKSDLRLISMSDLDAIIIGAGHNGLTCAAYLGMAGFRVRGLERRGVVGGACVTEEFHPGLPNSTAAYTGGPPPPQGIRRPKA